MSEELEHLGTVRGRWSSTERRMQLDLRQAVDEHTAAGWTVVNRSPLVLGRGHMWCELRMVGARAARINLPRPRA